MSIQKIPYRDLLSFNRLYRDYHEKFYHDLLCLEMTFLQHNGHNFKIMIDHEAYHVQITLRKVMILRDMDMKSFPCRTNYFDNEMCSISRAENTLILTDYNNVVV